jgi:mannitol 2-dehydrogenase
VPDVTPYENMKIRMLNGSHAIIAYPAGLMEIQFAHEAMQNELIRAFLEKVEFDEIIPIVPPVPDTDLKAYYELIVRRFANPKIGDTIRRLCLDGSNRQPKFIIPSIADNLKATNKVSGLALASALWCRYCHGTTDSGQEIEPNDPNWERLQSQARKAKDAPAAWLEMKDIYGDTADARLFVEQFSAWLEMLSTLGTQAVLQRYLSGQI